MEGENMTQPIAKPPRSNYIQSRNMKEAQSYLWEASLEQNAMDTLHLQMAMIHIGREIKHRSHTENGQKALVRLQELNAEFGVPEFLSAAAKVQE
jgi:hypothetical protein